MPKNPQPLAEVLNSGTAHRLRSHRLVESPKDAPKEQVCAWMPGLGPGLALTVELRKKHASCCNIPSRTCP